MRLTLKYLICVLVVARTVQGQEVSISVLGLFHPQHLTLKATPTQALVIQAGPKDFVLERSSGQDTADISSSDKGLILQVGNQMVRVPALRVAGRSRGATDFLLTVPARITRRYHGALEVQVASGILIPIVAMDLETAVASTVDAESDPDAPLEAMKAQSVATRSYFVAARGRHHDFDFCDTTHCQFLREPPSPESNASRAAFATRGLVLSYREQPVAAMFTRSCGGRTRTPVEVGMPHQAYPYFPVNCDYCRRNPWRWIRRLGPADAADLHRRGEASRLDIDRRLGWNTVPSNNFNTQIKGREVVLEGAGQGHGIGLCQRGAKDLAQAGASFRDILEHYYPNTALIRTDSVAGSPLPSRHAGASTP
jgi:stage II sporulation protein D